MPVKRKFVYLIRTGISSIQNEQRMLDDHGRNGWELIAVCSRAVILKHGADPDIVYYFKKRTK